MPAAQQLPRIVIAGGGPVGLAAALTLAREGIATTVIEADAGVCDGSRAICISRRSLQLLDRLGVAAPFLAKGFGWTEGRSYLGMAEVFHLRMPQGPDDRFPPFINIQQYYAERFLLEACTATGLVDVQWQTSVTDVQVHDDGVVLTITRDGHDESLRADWLIAADGARSLVRERLGLSLEGRSFERRYLIADIALKCDWPVERKVWFDPVSNPGSTIIMHKQPDDVWRVDYQLLPDEDSDEALLEDNVRARIAAHLAMVGLREPWQLLWRSLYRAHTLSLAEYVHGCVIFAGDAAHLVPIFGVRGLNSGLEDAQNLAWKLALVLRGLAPTDILETYTEERRAACLENIESATKSTWFMSPPSEGFALARDAVLELAVDHPSFRALINPRQSAAHRYHSSAIAPSPSRVVGLPLPEACLADGRSLHDLVGSGFSVLNFTESKAATVRERALGGLNYIETSVPVSDPSAIILGVSAGDRLLIRPDGYVAACARAQDGVDIRSMMSQIGLFGEEERHAAAV